MRNEIPYNKPHIKNGNVERLKPYLEGKKILKDLHFGFRLDSSTHTSIHTMQKYIAQPVAHILLFFIDHNKIQYI